MLLQQERPQRCFRGCRSRQKLVLLLMPLRRVQSIRSVFQNHNCLSRELIDCLSIEACQASCHGRGIDWRRAGSAERKRVNAVPARVSSAPNLIKPLYPRSTILPSFHPPILWTSRSVHEAGDGIGPGGFRVQAEARSVGGRSR